MRLAKPSAGPYFPRAVRPGQPRLPRSYGRRAGVAQLVEQDFRKVEVGGSSPSAGTIRLNTGPGRLLFSSIPFLYVFLPVVLVGFHLLSRHVGMVAAAVWLTAASLVFYGYWKIDYLALLLGSILLNYICGRLLQATAGGLARGILTAGLAGNLALLGYFKYAAFFCRAVLSDTAACAPVSFELPLAISFFTFTQIAFLVDVYRRQVSDLDPLRYALFVVFFPHLIAGPIVHYHAVGPQLADRKRFRISAENLAIGGAVFAVGLFKKVALADRFGEIAGPVFLAADSSTVITAVSAWAGMLAYGLQLYFDFSGYSDMAVGLALMFGIRFPANFHSPYKATSLIEFWRRWHITLSLFLRDYLYIPLGGSRAGALRRYLNLLVTMLLGGLWHGANWTFLLWGGLHGLGLALNHLWRAVVPAAWQPALRHPAAIAASWLLTMLFVFLCWVCFRAGSLDAALKLYAAMLGQTSGAAEHVAVLAYPKLRQVAWLAGGLLLCLLSPNTNQLFGIPVRGLTVTPPAALLRFNYRLVDLLAITLLLALSLVKLLNNAPSEFLYFDF